jgi:hypothetical protein
MPFTEIQKTKIIALLQTKGWELRDGVIWPPSRGLYFNNSHFTHWTPRQMHEVCSQRAARLKRLEEWRPGLLDHADAENLQASWAAEEVMKINL